MSYLLVYILYRKKISVIKAIRNIGNFQQSKYIYRASELCKGCGNKGKSSGEKKLYGLAATRNPTMVENFF